MNYLDEIFVSAWINRLIEAGCTTWVVCTGGRNAPLLIELLSHNQINLFNHFEERAASFFALGLCQAKKSPVAVCTTSGTAVAECLPAVIEAHYQKLPLVIVSADRPKRFRGTGAPQAIEQSQIFGKYCEQSFDISSDEEPVYSALDLSEELIKRPLKGPIHLNICLEDPYRAPATYDVAAVAQTDLSAPNLCQPNLLAPGIEGLTLIVVGPLLDPDSQNLGQALLTESLKSIPEALFCFELMSNLNLERLAPFRDRCLVDPSTWFRAHNGFNIQESLSLQRVIRIGEVPSFSFWRDLELSKVPIYQFTARGWSGLSADNHQVFPLDGQAFDILAKLTKSSGQCRVKVSPALNPRAEETFGLEHILGLLQAQPLSEQSLVLHLLKKNDGASIYLGNSQPIRECNFAAVLSFMRPDVVGRFSFESAWGFRGANGIDGQVSGFLGWVQAQSGSFFLGVFGDLTALYDLSAPWVAGTLRAKAVNVVVLNNQGPEIFQKLFSRLNPKPEKLAVDNLLTTHSIEFSAWAKLWSLDYHFVDRPEQFSTIPFQRPGPRIIEVKPDLAQTRELAKFIGY
jgi:2-succinyl-5-enolpyruvyl-6-hydroxy-3-cyclohexene-1-carboxylate synthase